MALPQILEWYSLSAMVDERKAPQAFLKNLLFGRVETQPTENIVWDELSGGRNVAPFVSRNGEAIMSGGYSEVERNVMAPNISIKRPFTAADLLFRRHAGDNIVLTGADQVSSAAEREIARQMQRLDDEVANAEEYLVAQAIRGSISYEAADEAVFDITFPKSVGNTITLSDFWDQTAVVPQNVWTARRRMHDQVSLQPTHCILGEEAADAFIANASVKEYLDLRRVVTGNLDLTQDVVSQGELMGAMFLGTMFGIQFWAYHPTVTLPDGSSYDLIRPKYAEFVHAGPAAENVMFYGAIADLDANEQGLIQTTRFSKTWRERDPSEQMVVLKSRPLPVPKRPDSIVSMKVVSG